MTRKDKTTRSAQLDSDIARNIRQALKLDNDVPDEHIRVEVSHGLATLEGTVETDLQKEAAEADARRVKGVRDVMNRIGLESTYSGALS
jgi:osmotically-inducible protein OsmY